MFALRDVPGVPVLTSFAVTGEARSTTELCVLPVSSSALPGLGVTSTIVNPADDRTVYRVVLIDVRIVDGVEPDGVAIDASPDHAASYDSLMSGGAIPGLTSSSAQVAGFDPGMLAAATVGTAAGKAVSPALVSPISEVVELGALRPVARHADGNTVAGSVGDVAGFAQLADDMRSVILYLHANDVVHPDRERPGDHVPEHAVGRSDDRRGSGAADGRVHRPVAAVHRCRAGDRRGDRR